MEAGLELLLKQCCIGARLDSNERFDPPRCDPSTRVAITKEIVDWVAGGSESASAIILYGPAGLGKSALAQSVGEICQKEERLVSTHFLSRTAPNPLRSNGNTVIPTLVYQLIQVLPWLRTAVLGDLEDDPGIFELSRAVLFDRLFTRHFRSASQCFSSGSTQARLIIIDGLDECSNRDIQRDLLRIIATALPHLAYPFRFLITSRPEPHIMSIINRSPAFRAGHTRCIDLYEDPNSAADIRTFLVNELDRIRRTHLLGQYLPLEWPSGGDVEKLLLRASGQFIYVDTVLRSLRSTEHRPDEQLKIILGLSRSSKSVNPLDRLDKLYRHILSRVKDISTVRRILGILRLSTLGSRLAPGILEGKITIVEIPSPTPSSLEKVLMLRSGEIEFSLREVASVIRVMSRDVPIKVLHASFFDFLPDPSRAGNLKLDLSLAHRSLAEFRLSEVNFASGSVDHRAVLLSLVPFFYHCQDAKLSQKILDGMNQATQFVLDSYSHTAEGDADISIGLLGGSLRSVANIFARKDYPHEAASENFISSITQLWREFNYSPARVPSENVEELQYVAKMKEVFRPMVDAFCYALIDLPSEPRRRRKSISVLKGQWRSRKLPPGDPDDTALAWELMGNDPETPVDLQGAIHSATFLLLVRSICHWKEDATTTYSNALSFWSLVFLMEVLRRPRDEFEPFDAAVLLIAVTLLRAVRHHTDRLQFPASDGNDALRREYARFMDPTAPPELLKFPNILDAFCQVIEELV